MKNTHISIIKRFQKTSFAKYFSSTKSQNRCCLKRIFDKLGFRNGLIVWTEGLAGEIKLFTKNLRGCPPEKNSYARCF